MVSVLGVLLVRPRVSGHGAHRRRAIAARASTAASSATRCTTLDAVGDADNVGHVELAGERWRAVSGSDDPLPAGTKVLITGVQGTTLIVWPADGHLPVDLQGET